MHKSATINNNFCCPLIKTPSFRTTSDNKLIYNPSLRKILSPTDTKQIKN